MPFKALPKQIFGESQNWPLFSLVVFDKSFFKVFLKGINAEVFAIDDHFDKFVSKAHYAFHLYCTLKKPLPEKVSRAGVMNRKLLHSEYGIIAAHTNTKGPLVSFQVIHMVSL